MHRNLYWYVFLAVILLVVLWYTGKFGYSYYNYVTLNRRVPVKNMSWSVHGITDEKYHIKGNYEFLAEGHLETGETVLTDHNYWNPKAAEKAIPEYARQKWRVWYNASNPHHSSLEKNFPFKESLSAAVMWALFLYFIWLGYHATHLRR